MGARARHSSSSQIALKQASTTAKGAAVLQSLLRELALVLLPRGMTPKWFSDLARSAFVQAAADISKLRNGRVNHSRVAAQTGLTRADVKRLLRQKAFQNKRRGLTAVEKVIDGWRTDPQFLSRSGQPKRLEISGRKGSFADLVKKHGGDVPHRAVLDEMRRISAVQECEGTVRLRRSLQLRLRNNFAFLSPVLPLLVDGLQIASNTRRADSSSIQRLTIPAETEVDLAVARERCDSSAKSLLEGLAHSLGQARGGRRRTSHRAITVTILLTENGKRNRRKGGHTVM
jgi:Family of unknown function (DUF6502)